MSAGSIVGIVAGVIFGIAFLAFLWKVFVEDKKKRMRRITHPPRNNTTASVTLSAVETATSTAAAVSSMSLNNVDAFGTLESVLIREVSKTSGVNY